MEKTDLSDQIADIAAELNTIIIALGNRDIFSDTTQDICISLIKIREQMGKINKKIDQAFPKKL